MITVATAASLSVPISIYKSTKLLTKRGAKARLRDPRSKAPQLRGKFLDVNQALEVARYDIQYLDWRPARIFLLSCSSTRRLWRFLNPLAREYKSIGTSQEGSRGFARRVGTSSQTVHISEARVATALDKLAYMETLVNDRLLQEGRSATTAE
ncbi:hypothetical protein MLD38_034012 [Melastoma candidum]|uniref:Uncharacterized protein n=1 Tax=Melastoma candidum TaxID=119954 RepID=A0ACB9M938_9MYRT|nr:hypothetical protein MLD38_034012 [Melastoma candidum]